MTLKLELPSLDGLDDTIRALYKQDGDKFRLQVDGLPDVSGLKAKNEELLAETKAEREKRVALETEKAAAEETAAKEKGQFKELYEKEQSTRSKLETDLAALKDTVRKKDVDGEALKIATELTRDTARAGLLQQQASQFLKHTETGVQFEIGGVPVERAKVLEHLKEAYPFLADGNQAGGGGASGSNGGAGTDKGNFAGDKTERTAAINAKFPELSKG